jgi:hypothetical protein
LVNLMNQTGSIFNSSDLDDSVLTKRIRKDKQLKIRATKKPYRWSTTDTGLFFKCIEFFGTDLEMMLGVFQGKSLRQLSRKLHKEKKRNP